MSISPNIPIVYDGSSKTWTTWVKTQIECFFHFGGEAYFVLPDTSKVILYARNPSTRETVCKICLYITIIFPIIMKFTQILLRDDRNQFSVRDIMQEWDESLQITPKIIENARTVLSSHRIHPSSKYYAGDSIFMTRQPDDPKAPALIFKRQHTEEKQIEQRFKRMLDIAQTAAILGLQHILVPEAKFIQGNGETPSFIIERLYDTPNDIEHQYVLYQKHVTTDAIKELTQLILMFCLWDVDPSNMSVMLVEQRATILLVDTEDCNPSRTADGFYGAPLKHKHSGLFNFIGMDQIDVVAEIAKQNRLFPPKCATFNEVIAESRARCSQDLNLQTFHTTNGYLTTDGENNFHPIAESDLYIPQLTKKTFTYFTEMFDSRTNQQLPLGQAIKHVIYSINSGLLKNYLDKRTAPLQIKRLVKLNLYEKVEANQAGILPCGTTRLYHAQTNGLKSTYRENWLFTILDALKTQGFIFNATVSGHLCLIQA